MSMLAAVLLALAASTSSPPQATPPLRVRASAEAMVRILVATEIRGGQTSAPHQRREATAADGTRLTTIEFE
jgi:hypothetical protein